MFLLIYCRSEPSWEWNRETSMWPNCYGLAVVQSCVKSLHSQLLKRSELAISQSQCCSWSSRIPSHSAQSRKKHQPVEYAKGTKEDLGISEGEEVAPEEKPSGNFRTLKYFGAFRFWVTTDSRFKNVEMIHLFEKNMNIFMWPLSINNITVQRRGK